jgi:hypothetical protein
MTSRISKILAQVTKIRNVFLHHSLFGPGNSLYRVNQQHFL